MPPIEIHFPDSDYEKPFRAYSNHFQELAGVIGGRYGMEETLVEGVYAAMRQHPPLRQVQKRTLSRGCEAELRAALTKAWSFMQRVGREVAEDFYDEEANAWLPEQAYYSVHHGMRAVILATGAHAPSEHRRVLNVISREVVAGRLIFPWSARCEGCPEFGTARFPGVGAKGDLNPLKSPDPATAEERIALLLRTTRAKELKRRNAQARLKNVRPGRTRRALRKDEKLAAAEKLAPTTLFDFLYRTRKKAHYEDPDAFVLGSAGPDDARTLGESMAIVTDATLTALECLVATYVGRGLVAKAVLNYADRIHASAASPVGRRAQVWAGLVPSTV